MQLTDEERALCSKALRLYREQDDESDGGDYSNRDELEEKLRTGRGELSESDIGVLQLAAANTLPDDEWTKINEVLQKLS